MNKALLLQLDSYFVHFKDDPSYYPAAVFKIFADKMIAQTVGLCFRSLPDSWKVVVRALLRHLNEDQSRLYSTHRFTIREHSCDKQSCNILPQVFRPPNF